jgi:ketosteroid isomerase-like protein
MNKLFIGSLLVVFLFSCQNSGQQSEIWKKEIIDTERAFSEMAKSEGVPKAFITFAADEVVVLRSNKLIKGKNALKASYEKGMASENFSLTWKPDFVDVSASGDLGYTYGKYVYTAIDSLGNTKSSEGIFHTVWKRQQDGSWKFVWD